MDRRRVCYLARSPGPFPAVGRIDEGGNSVENEEPVREGTSRREFLRNVGLYAVPSFIAGSVLIGEAPKVFAIPTPPAPSESTSASSSSGSACTLPLDLLSILQADLATLQANSPLSQASANLQLQAAIRALTTATNTSLWNGGGTNVLPGLGAPTVVTSIVTAGEALNRINPLPGGISNVPLDLVTVLSGLVSAAVTTNLTNIANEATTGNYNQALVQLSVLWQAASFL